MTYLSDNIYPTDWEVVSDDLVIGPSRSHMIDFQLHRAAVIKQLAMETDKLVTRMTQLTRKTKLKERLNVKLWTSKLRSVTSPQQCTTCDSMILTKKKQCKLCDTVICQACAKYIDFDEGNEALLQSGPVPTKLEKKLKRLRLCARCEHLVDLRKPFAPEYDSPLVTIHDQMRNLMVSSRTVVEIFCTINQSLLDGETTYELSDLMSLRDRLSQTADVIRALSQKISVLPATSGSRQARLQGYIRMAATVFIKEYLLPIQLPSQAQVEEARQKRVAVLSKRRR